MAGLRDPALQPHLGVGLSLLLTLFIQAETLVGPPEQDGFLAGRQQMPSSLTPWTPVNESLGPEGQGALV